MPRLVNALLVRYSGGYVWVTDAGSIAANGRKEAMLQSGNVASSDEAARIGNAVLAERAAVQLAYQCDLDPVGAGDNPYVDFGMGDYVSCPDDTGTAQSVRVVGLTVTEDGDGLTTVTPELNTLHQVFEQRVDRWLQRMNTGALQGTVESAAPVPQPPPTAPRGSTRMMPPWQTIGTPDLSVSKPYRPPDYERIIGFEVDVYGNTGTTTVVLLKNGASTGVSVSVGAGVGTVIVPCSVVVNGPGGDYAQVQTTALGGATSITAKALLG